MLARTIFGSLAASALVAGGLAAAPASAHGDHHHHHRGHEVKVLVCVKLEDRHGDDHGDHHGDQRSSSYGDDHGDHHGDHGDVGILVRTDRDRAWTRLGDDECARFRLDFRRPWLSVSAFPEDHESEVRFKTFGDDVLNSFSRDNQLFVHFDGHQRDPFVGVGVLVEEDHDHGDHTGDHTGDRAA